MIRMEAEVELFNLRMIYIATEQVWVSCTKLLIFRLPKDPQQKTNQKWGPNGSVCSAA